MRTISKFISGLLKSLKKNVGRNKRSYRDASRVSDRPLISSSTNNTPDSTNIDSMSSQSGLPNNLNLDVKSIKEISGKNKKVIFSPRQIKDIYDKAKKTFSGKPATELNANLILEKLLKIEGKLKHKYNQSQMLIEEIESNFPADVYRFGKKSNKHRTAVVGFGQNNQVALVGLNNRKTASYVGGEKDYPEAFLGKGTYKKVKDSYNLTNSNPNQDEPALLARASIILDPYNLKGNVEEMKMLMEKFSDSNYILSPKLISSPFIRDRNGKKEVVMYAFYEPAECSLEEFLNKAELRKKILSKDQYDDYQNFIEGKSTVVPDFIKNIMLNITQGVVDIHKQNLVHQDLKPDNILLFRDKNNNLVAKVTDFGLAAENGDETKNSAYSLPVAAPEVISANSSDQYYMNQNINSYGRIVFWENLQYYLTCLINGQNKNPSQKTDIWALGMINHAILTCSGKKLFQSNNIDLKRDVDMSKQKYAFIKDSLDPDPDKRPHIEGFLNKQMLDLNINSTDSSKNIMQI